MGDRVRAYTGKQCTHTHAHTLMGVLLRYCGSNNINLLNPDGQFGSRHSNHAGAARYISAGLEKVTRFIVREEDDPILKYLKDDGQAIEPEYFLPIIPIVLINGRSVHMHPYSDLHCISHDN